MTTTAGQYNCVIETAGCADSSTIGVFLELFDLPVVSVSSNDSGFCPGGVVTINGSNGGQSQWFFNGDTIPGATSNSYLASAEGWYNMVKTNMNGCSDSAATGVYLMEYENPDVNLGPDDGYCDGDSIILDAGSFPGASYFWTPFANTQMVTVTSAGTYIALVQSAEGCTGSDTIEIEEYPAPVIDLGADTVLCVEDQASITLDAGTGFAGYLWNDGSDQSTLTYTRTNVGHDTLICIVTDSNGCQGMDTVVVSVDICGGAAENALDFSKVFPNPSSGTSIIQSDRLITEVSIINAMGQLVSQQQVRSKNFEINVDVPGTYLIILEDEQGRSALHRLNVQ